MKVTRDRLHLLRPEIDQIGLRFGIIDVRLFGSTARGTAHEGSDVDLLVRIEAGRSLLDLIGFQQDVAELIGSSVDVVEEGGIHPLLEAAILVEALPL